MLGGLPFLCGADTGAMSSRVSALNLLKMLQHSPLNGICSSTVAPDWVRSSRIPGPTMLLIGAPDCVLLPRLDKYNTMHLFTTLEWFHAYPHHMPDVLMVPLGPRRFLAFCRSWPTGNRYLKKGYKCALNLLRQLAHWLYSANRDIKGIVHTEPRWPIQTSHRTLTVDRVPNGNKAFSRSTFSHIWAQPVIVVPGCPLLLLSFCGSLFTYTFSFLCLFPLELCLFP